MTVAVAAARGHSRFRRGVAVAAATGAGLTGLLSGIRPAYGDVIGDGGADRAAQLLARAAQAAADTAYSGQELVVDASAPARRQAVVSVAHPSGSLTQPGSGLSPPPLDLIQEHYLLSTAAATDTVAGRQADVVAVRTRDGRVVARFWLDRATGLVLRRELHDAAGRVVQASSFLRLRVGTAATATTTAPTPWRLDLGRSQLSALRAHGWWVRATLPDGLELYDARMGIIGGARVLHLCYSDGLSTVSVFEEKGRLNTARLAGWQRDRMGSATVWLQNAPLRVVSSGRDTVYTVVADAPVAVVRAVVTHLPHGKQHAGLWSRIVHGLARIASWLNPFD